MTFLVFSQKQEDKSVVIGDLYLFDVVKPGRTFHTINLGKKHCDLEIILMIFIIILEMISLIINPEERKVKFLD